MRTTALASVLLAVLAFPAAPARAEEGQVEEGNRALRENLVVKAVQKAGPATVSVRTNQIVQATFFNWLDSAWQRREYERDGGLGSGVVFHPDGYVITNAHVISRASKIFVNVHAGKERGTVEHRAEAIVVDLENDLAILRLVPDDPHAAPRLPHLDLGRSDDLMLGETVIAIGHPFRLGMTVTTGILSGMNRGVTVPSPHPISFDDLLQVDAAINPGNSGGPLFDVTGRWIGVNTAIYNRATGAEGIGFAIPADRIRSLVAKAFKRRIVQGDWMGIEFAEGERGEAVVSVVFPGGPAEGKGIRKGDVVVAVDGKKTPTLYDVRLATATRPGADPFRLTLRRGARVLPQPARVPLARVETDALSMARLGLQAADTRIDGVIVSRLREGGPAQKVGLRRLDIITELGDRQIRNTDDLLLFLQFVRPGDLVDVRVVRPLGGNNAVESAGVLEAE